MNEVEFTQLITLLQREMGQIRDAVKNISYASAVTTAPDDATYVVISNTANLSAERALAVGATLTLTDGGAGSSVTLALTTHTHQNAGVQGGTLDHGLALTGLSDDDHTQYRLESVDHTHQTTGAEAGKLDHGLALDGLADDDHTQYLLRSLLTTLGDTPYGGAAGAWTRLAGNVTATRKFLEQTGNGVLSAAPTWDTVTKSDVGLSAVENTALSTWAGTTNLTTLGTIATGVWSGTVIAIAKGGTGQVTAGPAFDALSPVTTRGDLIYRNATVNARLAVGASAGMFLRSDATDPGWSTLILPNSATAGRLVFASATNTYGEDGGMVWDNSAKTLGIGKAANSGKIEVWKAATTGANPNTSPFFTLNSTTAGLTAGDKVNFTFRANNDGAGIGAFRAEIETTASEAAKFVISLNNGAATSDRFSLIGSTGVLALNGYGAGTATFDANGVISSASDEDLKIKDGTVAKPISMLMALAPGYYYGKSGVNIARGRQLGFYAQNVRVAIGPEAAPDPVERVLIDEKGNNFRFTPPWGYYDRSVLAVAILALQEHEGRLVKLEK